MPGEETEVWQREAHEYTALTRPLEQGHGLAEG